MSKDIQTMPVWLRPKEVTRIYQIGRSTLYSWIARGLIKSTTLRTNRYQRHGIRLINRASLDDLLERNAKGGAIVAPDRKGGAQ